MSSMMDVQKMEERRQKRHEAKLRIQALYEDVSIGFREKSHQWLKMVEELEAYAAPAVWAVLNNSAFASRTSFEAIAGITREALYSDKVFEGYRKMLESNAECMFSDYCRGIYRHKALDYIRALAVRAQMEGTLEPGVEPGHVGSEDTFDRFELSEKERFLKYYVDALTASDANPFHIILLCYSKIVPVILQLTNCDSADTWAWTYMQGKPMQRLSDEFIIVFNSTMRVIRASWGEAYLAALEEPYTDCHGNETKLAEAVLTDEFTQSNTKNWVARTNVKIKKQIIKDILRSKDEDLVELTMRYTQEKYSV